MTDYRNAIVTALTKKHGNEWMGENIITTMSAVHSCNPMRRNGYHADAVEIDGNVMREGTVHWNFDEEMEDGSNYNWDCDWEFISEFEYDITDDVDRQELCEILGIEI